MAHPLAFATALVLGSFLGTLLGLLSFLTAIFLILLVLIQRGRGGGLAGALGGMGGQSAFGTKAGDVFTKVTIVAASVWILLCMFSIKLLNKSVYQRAPSPSSISGPELPGEGESDEASTGDGDTSTDEDADVDPLDDSDIFPGTDPPTGETGN